MIGEKRVVITRTPFRLSFVGGGTDIPEYYKKYGTGAVVSGAMDKYMFITASQYFFPDRIRIHYVRTENDITDVNDIKHPSIRECLKLLKITQGIQVSSVADVPSKGTGIGSSSSFAVGLLNALHTWKGDMVTQEQLAQEAVYIERTALREAGGKQDQYAAAFGGIMLMEFMKDEKVKVKRVKLAKKDLNELEKHLLLVYTGGERAASNIEATKRSEFDLHPEILGKMADLAYKQFDAFESGRWHETGRLLHENWLLKKQLAKEVSNEYIDKLYNIALKHGAQGGKIMGAGGGGFLLFFADPSKHKGIIDALAGLKAEQFSFAMEGSKVIYSQGEPIKV